MKTDKEVITPWQIFSDNDYETKNTEGFEGATSSEARFMTWRHPQFGC